MRKIAFTTVMVVLLDAVIVTFGFGLTEQDVSAKSKIIKINSAKYSQKNRETTVSYTLSKDIPKTYEIKNTVNDPATHHGKNISRKKDTHEAKINGKINIKADLSALGSIRLKKNPRILLHHQRHPGTG